MAHRTYLVLPQPTTVTTSVARHTPDLIWWEDGSGPWHSSLLQWTSPDQAEALLTQNNPCSHPWAHTPSSRLNETPIAALIHRRSLGATELSLPAAKRRATKLVSASLPWEERSGQEETHSRARLGVSAQILYRSLWSCSPIWFVYNCISTQTSDNETMEMVFQCPSVWETHLLLSVPQHPPRQGAALHTNSHALITKQGI